MFDKLVGACLGLLIAAVAVHVAVRLIQSVAATLVIIVAAIGGVLFTGVLARAWWRSRVMNRW